MPDLYKDDIPEIPYTPVAEEAEECRKVLEYTDEKHNPARADYLDIISTCYDFKELRQWNGEEKYLLDKLQVPELAVDMIGRLRQNINGIKDNANLNYVVKKRELGDEAVAELLNKTLEWVIYNSDYEEVRDEAWDNMCDVGIGNRKWGWDDTQMGGEGMFWFENIAPEDCGWSYTRKKNFSDIRWWWQRTTMSWEDAIKLAPDKAPALRSLKSVLVKKWDEIKGKHSGTSASQIDYSGSVKGTPEGAYEYPDQVVIYDVWVKRILPYKKVVFPTGQVQIGRDPMGNPMLSPLNAMKKVPINYQTADGEQLQGTGVDEVWYQHLVATGKEKTSSILLTPVGGVPSEESFPKIEPMVAQFKKNGQPVGVIEPAIPHQKRRNVAWAEKTAFNIKAIKSILAVTTPDGKFDVEKATQDSQFGGIMTLRQGEEINWVNQVPNVNLQAIEEGQSAKEDMEFATGGVEPVMRGLGSSGDSGVKTAQLQNAAMIPLNQWVKAMERSEVSLRRKVLQVIIKKFTPDRYIRIIGEQEIMRLFPIYQQGIFPQITADAYDVTVQNESISDFNKQQSFNASLALQQVEPYGTFDPEYLIMNAPIKNPEEALASYQKRKQDFTLQLMMRVQMLEEALGVAQKQAGKNNIQSANAQRGKSEPQNGRQSMMGGMSPNSMVGMGMQ